MRTLSKETLEKYEYLKSNNTYENVVSFIIGFISEYRGKQGFYEYFSLFGSCCKAHYRGYFNKFIFQENRSDISNKKLVFKVNAVASVELPTKRFEGVDKFTKSIYEDIKRRAPKDIDKGLIAELKQYLNPYFDLKDIRVTIRPRWRYKIAIDDYFFDWGI